MLREISKVVVERKRIRHNKGRGDVVTPPFVILSKVSFLKHIFCLSMILPFRLSGWRKYGTTWIGIGEV